MPKSILGRKLALNAKTKCALGVKMRYDIERIISMSSDDFYGYVDENIFAEEKPKSIPMTFEESISFDSLYDSMLKCRKGVMWKTSVVGYLGHSIDNISRLESKLKDGTYEARKPFHFVVYSPKKRDIVAVHFEDRLVQRSLNDNIIYPIMTKPFVDSNCACQKGKGTEYGINLLKKYLYRCYKMFGGNDFYVLQVDIKGYYPNMSHQYIEKLFRDRLDPNTYAFVEETMRSQYPSEKGYNPGSQLIQIAGISCLNGTDHWFKETKHCPFYIRYMDDILAFGQSREFLKIMLNEFNRKLSEIGFECNERKTEIYKQSDGIMFLGFKFFVNETGKIVQLASSDTLKRDRRHWKNMAKSIINGKYESLTVEKFEESVNSTINYVKKAKTFELRNKISKEKENMIKYIRSEEKIHGKHQNQVKNARRDG